MLTRQILKNIFNNSITSSLKQTSIRCISYNKKLYKDAYQAEGKTTAHILNNEKELGLMINAFSQVGFRLNNDLTVLGPMVIFPRSVLSWTVKDMTDINEESLSIFTVLEPKLDIVVLGTGDTVSDYSFQKQMFAFMKKYKMTFEILPTESACATFNFLNSEGRNVAAALIPPTIIETHADDMLRSKLRYQNLYETEWGAEDKNRQY